MPKRFKFAIVGGTFDHFHKGHEALLFKAFSVADKVFVGITSDAMAAKKQNPKIIERFSERNRAVAGFIAKTHPASCSQITKINDAFGPAAVWKKADAIIVTKDTLAGARKINAARKSAKVAAAAIVVCPFAKAKDGHRISSLSIRQGLIDRSGNVYLHEKTLPKRFLMPKSLAGQLGKPFGRLFFEPNAARNASVVLRKARPALVAAVGDETFKALYANGIQVGLAIVDGSTLRKITGLPSGLPKPITHISNPAGQVTRQLIRAIKKSVRATVFSSPESKGRTIVVHGEEDLAVIPTILALPLGSVVLYGQPKIGIVAVVVGESEKEKAFGFLCKFKKRA